MRPGNNIGILHISFYLVDSQHTDRICSNEFLTNRLNGIDKSTGLLDYEFIDHGLYIRHDSSGKGKSKLSVDILGQRAVEQVEIHANPLTKANIWNLRRVIYMILRRVSLDTHSMGNCVKRVVGQWFSEFGSFLVLILNIQIEQIKNENQIY
ncbi:energy-coupling factor transporter ATP-binding protein EcfA1 [Striga asiatica]|uniref:Energy-coupling factor transporter ATP-binding protein EcfA1 n=1 Tax=Striga asiatica TaxID=4170 RepID=A0A5A7P6V5_STRAF|nr:energy-coupling factor transporter ATP-binding protein EcfA1 [Striga asiatica]